MSDNVKKVAFIFFGDQWDLQWRRRQQFAYQLARLPETKKVIYMEFPLTVISLFKLFIGRADHEATARWKRVFKLGLTPCLEGVQVITPVSCCGRYSLGLLRKLNDLFLEKTVLWLVSKSLQNDSETNAPLFLWVSHPSAARYVDKFSYTLLCYDCTENFTCFPYSSVVVQEEVKRSDRYLTQRSDLIFVQTNPFLLAKRELNSNTYVVANGTDYDLFTKNQDVPEPTDLQRIKRPIIAYTGNLDFRIDYSLLRQIITKHPDWSFVFIGQYNERKCSDLLKFDNTYFLGQKTYQMIPRYLNHVDVCLIPYKDERDIGWPSPLKLFDYLASGKPIVSTPMSAVEDFSDVILTASSSEEFSYMISLALQNNDPKKDAKRIEYARNSSWEHRTKQVWSLITETLLARRQAVREVLCAATE